MIIFLDRQHSGKPLRPRDLGAGVDIDGDGSIAMEESEAILTAYYLLSAEIALRAHGYHVIPLSDGGYHERHERANSYHPHDESAIYVAAHLNAGGGGYGCFFYDHRSTTGERLARHLKEACKDALPEVRSWRTIPAERGNWTKNAYHTIMGVRATAICAEPLFMDCEPHAPLLTREGMERVGRALADGIHNYIRQL